MEINVLYFAVFRERLGKEGETLALAEGATVADAVAALEARHDTVRNLRGRYQVALNQEMVSPTAALADGDELVLIPPVAGGADPRARILEEPLSVDRVIELVSSSECGGIATFTGVVRRRSQGRDVERLEYEAYAAMAEKTFTDIIDEIEGEIPGTRLATEHRVGTLAVGDVAVVIACAAPHRAEAFAGCRAMIDRLKDRAPIWKREVGPDGSEWVGLGP
jgi:molybdopterin synthase catalytic subunit